MFKAVRPLLLPYFRCQFSGRTPSQYTFKKKRIINFKLVKYILTKKKRIQSIELINQMDFFA